MVRALIGLATFFLIIPTLAGAETFGSLSKVAAAPCEAVARGAQALPPDAWSGAGKRLGGLLQLVHETNGSPEHPFSNVAKRIAENPGVMEAIGAGETSVTFIEHPTGASLYQVYTVQGTLHEQTSTFVRVDAGGAISMVATPTSARGGSYTTVEDLGVIGNHLFVVDHGPNEAESPDEDIQLTPWTGQGFGPACRVALRFNTDHRATESFGNPATIAAGERTALGLARSLDAGNTRGSQNSDDTQTGPDKDKIARLEFPTFGHERFLPGWNYVDGRIIHIILEGRPLLAVYGHEGVGWRSGMTILVAFYRDDQGKRTPIASFIIERFATKLRSATVLPPVLELHTG